MFILEHLIQYGTDRVYYSDVQLGFSDGYPYSIYTLLLIAQKEMSLTFSNQAWSPFSSSVPWPPLHGYRALVWEGVPLCNQFCGLKLKLYNQLSICIKPTEITIIIVYSIHTVYQGG